MPGGMSFMIGEYFCCCMAAGMPKMKMATDDRHIGLDARTSGLTPAIHIMVVVVSPTTLPAPPALEAATMAAR